VAKTIEIASREKPQTLSGKNVYDQYRCDLCHTIGGKGGTIGPDLSKVGSQREPNWIAKQVNDPKSNNPNTQMPAFPQISEDAMKALVDYLKSLK
jgi:cbb3-type cytochrome oxidase cytochrome c subunit